MKTILFAQEKYFNVKTKRHGCSITFEKDLLGLTLLVLDR